MSLDTVHSSIVMERHSSTEVFEINSLPFDLFPQIFKHLNVHDRKNVRLTCRLWNDVCQLQEVIKHEKFVFHLGKEGCDFPDLGPRIEECKALRSCLEFQGLPLCRLPSTLWANCGDRVESLFIHECEVDDATILNIIIHCTNLKTLHLQTITTRVGDEDSDEEPDPPATPADSDGEDSDEEPDPPATPADSDGEDSDEEPDPPATPADSDGEFCTEEVINELIRRNIERRNLTSLILYTPTALSTRKLRKLLQIFPCLRKLVEGTLIFESFEGTIELDEERETEWVFPPTMDIFVSNVEDDILNSLKRSNSKLKVFSPLVITDDSAAKNDLFLDLCHKQKELEKLALDCCSRDAKEFLFPALRSLPKLKELEFRIRTPESKCLHSPEVLSEFLVLTSNLESMHLDFDFYCPNYSSLRVIPSSSLAEYSKLKSLTVLHKNPNFLYEILRRCRISLHHLSVMEVNDEILQLLLESHTELKTLTCNLLGLYKLNKDGSNPAGEKYPFGKLRNLEYLHIVGIHPDTIRENISEFIFPELRCFEFDCMSYADLQDFRAMLRVVCKSAPYLETLRIHTCVFKSTDFVNLCTDVQMKYLRHITICSSLKVNPHTDEEFGSIDAVFNVCPSLCLISFVHDGCCTYSYNRHSKEVKCHSYLKIFDSRSVERFI